MAIKPKGKKVTGTNKADKITWLSSKVWKQNLTVNGLGGNDTINFKKSNYKNKLNGGAGNDKIYGGKKNDTIHGNAGNDLLVSGSGSDILYGDSGKNTIKGGAGNDKIYAGKNNDIIYGGDGSDVINLTKGGKNKVYGGNGNDKINFGLTDNYIDGGAGNDSIYGQGGFNTIKGGAGKDTIRAGMWFSNIDGGSDNDFIDARDANKSTLLGGAGDDIIYGGYFSDSVDGGAGNDKIYEYGNVDQYNTINGGAGNDTITVSSGNNAINGGDNDDEISIIGGVNVINAGTGNNQIHFDDDGWPVNYANTIQGGGGTDTLVLHKLNSFDSFSVEYDGDNLKVACGEANDIILENFKSGHSVKYVKIGDETRQITEFIPSNQTLDYSAQNINNIIYGGSGNDSITGGSGKDTIYGGIGDDTINGGNGNDEIIFNGSGYKTLYFGYNCGNDIVKFEQPIASLTLKIEGLDTESKNINFVQSGNDLLLEKTNPDETVDTITLKDFYTSENIPANANISIKDFEGNHNMLLSAYINNYSKSGGIVITTPDNENTYSFNNTNMNHVFISTANNDTVNINATNSVDLYFDYNSGDDTVYVNSQMGGNNHFNLHIAGADKTSKLLDFIQQGNDLIIKRPNPDESTDTITIKGYYLNSNNLPHYLNCEIYNMEEKVRYIDDYISQYSQYGYASFMGTDGNDIISTLNSKRIYPGAGDDEITIDGAYQTIFFEYNSGDDIITFNRKATLIQFNIEGATTDNTVLEVSGNDVLIKRTNPDETVDTITLKDYCTTSCKPDGGISIYDFDNRSVYSGIYYINGTDGEDTINITSRVNDIITPGKGNDTIIIKVSSGNSNITSGQKHLYLHNGDGNDTLQFDATFEERASKLNSNPCFHFDDGAVISHYKEGNNLIISRTYTDDEDVSHTENLTVENLFVRDRNSNDRCNIIIDNNTSYILQWHGKSDEANDNIAIGDNNTDTYLFGGSQNDKFLAYNTRYKNCCYLEGRDGDDEYIVHLGASQYSIINDSSGDSDSLVITDTAGGRTFNLFFELNNVVNSEHYDALSGDLYITYDLLNSIQDKKAGILITDYFGDGEIESVQLKDSIYATANTYNLTDEMINTIAQSVASWLTSDGRSYGSVADALADENLDLAGLIAAYQPQNATWQQV